MTGPRSVAPVETGSADREEKRRLDDALEEGLEETFPAVRPGQCHPAGALEGRPATSSGGTSGSGAGAALSRKYPFITDALCADRGRLRP